MPILMITTAICGYNTGSARKQRHGSHSGACFPPRNAGRRGKEKHGGSLFSELQLPRTPRSNVLFSPFLFKKGPF